MRRLMFVALAVMGLLSIVALGTTSASAAKPEFSPAPNNAITAGGASKFTEVEGIAEVTCTGSEGIAIITSLRLGRFDALALGCTAFLVGKCTGLPDTVRGSILMRGTFHLRYTVGKTHVAMILLIEPVHFECEKIVTLITWRGCLVSVLTPTDRKTKAFRFLLRQRGGHEEFTEVENESSDGAEVCVLQSEKNGEALKEGGLELEALISYETEGEVQA